ncbi:MAG TPA: hypothetical protein VI451_03690, partial [Anaerolineales bacterium]|nr:hypothetical protein [Anaerolineales bacterium]
MNPTIDNIKSIHEALSRRQQETDDPFDLIVEIQDFIQQIRLAGKDVPPGAERELLRSLVQYWASVYFDHSDTGVFPKTDLDPFTGEIPPELDTTPETPSFLPHLLERYDRYLRYIVIGLGVLGMLWVLTIIGQFFLNQPGDPQSTPIAILDQTRTANELQAASNAATESALIEETTRVAIVGTQTALSSDATRLAPTETPTPEPSVKPTITSSPTPTLAPQILFVELTNLKDQDTVAPKITLKGTYANLEPGWSIHVLIQNIAQEGAPFFPSSEFFTIPAGSTNGEWNIEVQFGKEEEWTVSTPYRVSFRIATTDSDREILLNAVSDGILDLAILPSTIKPPTNLIPTTVIRNSFENRIVYTRVSDEGVGVFSSSLDGKNEINLTGANSTTETDPAISNDGLSIVFVGRKTNHPDYNYSLWMMNSTGQNQVEFEGTRTFNPIERPAWSPDGNLIVYNERNLETGLWEVKILNRSDLQIRTISQERRNIRSPVWMPNGKFLIVSARSLNPVPINQTATSLSLFKIDVETGVESEIYTNP